MTGTIRLGKGVRREAESEESRRRNRGWWIVWCNRWSYRCWTPSSTLPFPTLATSRRKIRGLRLLFS